MIMLRYGSSEGGQVSAQEAQVSVQRSLSPQRRVGNAPELHTPPRAPLHTRMHLRWAQLTAGSG